MLYGQLRICPGEWDVQTPLGFGDTSGFPNLGQTTGSYNNQQQEQKKWEHAKLWTLQSRLNTE